MIGTIIAAVGQIVSLAGIIAGGIISISKVFSGQRCLLRSEMLRIYYKNKPVQKIRQYEYENFCMLYEAYKKLHGNSFIDKVMGEVKEWNVVS